MDDLRTFLRRVVIKLFEPKDSHSKCLLQHNDLTHVNGLNSNERKKAVFGDTDVWCLVYTLFSF